MGLLVFIVLVAALVMVIGFSLYGVLLGMASLGRVSKRLFWPELPTDGSLASARPQSVLAASAVDQPHCWDVKQCAPGNREQCLAYKHPDMPCWMATMRADGGYRLRPDCVTCSLFNLPALVK